MAEPRDRDESSLSDAAALDAEWRRCQREARSLTVLELAETALAVGILVIVALCGIVAITHSTVASAQPSLPLGLGLAVTIALSIFGFAFRERVRHELLNQEMFRLDCARRAAAEVARQQVLHPYRSAAATPAHPRCTLCLAATRDTFGRRDVWLAAR